MQARKFGIGQTQVPCRQSKIDHESTGKVLPPSEYIKKPFSNFLCTGNRKGTRVCFSQHSTLSAYGLLDYFLLDFICFGSPKKPSQEIRQRVQRARRSHYRSPSRLVRRAEADALMI